jgi:hypothetical protein
MYYLLISMKKKLKCFIKIIRRYPMMRRKKNIRLDMVYFRYSKKHRKGELNLPSVSVYTANQNTCLKVQSKEYNKVTNILEKKQEYSLMRSSSLLYLMAYKKSMLLKTKRKIWSHFSIKSISKMASLTNPMVVPSNNTYTNSNKEISIWINSPARKTKI